MPLKTIGTGRGLMGGGSYADKVRSYGPFAYWPLWEQSGTTAVCLTNSAMNGTYARNVAVMGTGAGIGDGYTAPIFTPGNDRVNIFSAALQAGFNGDEGTLMAWGIVANVGVWADGAQRRLVHCPHTDFNNFIFLSKDNVVQRFQNSRTANAGGINQQFNGLTTTNWFCTVLTWSTTAGRAASRR